MKKLYIIQQEGTNLYKIGFTRKPVKERIRQLQTGSANLLTEVFTFETEYAPKIEKTMQRRYNIYNISGEWFKFDTETLTKAIVEIEKTHCNLQFLEDNKI